MRTKTPVGNTNIVELSKVLANFHTSQDVFNFLHDIATPQEIETLAQRFQIAKLLWTTNLSYVEIANKTGASTTTVTRVARFLNQEPFGGYRQVLSTRYPKADHSKKKRRKT